MRARMIALLATACATLAPGVAPARAPQAARGATARPNIVVILADDLGYGDIGAYGQRRVKTPNLDALARDGVRFTDFYAGAPVCAPSRAALLTGRDTGHVRVRGNVRMGGDFTDEREFGQFPLKAGTAALPMMLQGAGYVTAAIGKWGLGGQGSEGIPTRQGFDYFYGYLDQSHAHNYYPTHLWENDRRVPLDNRFFFVHPALGKTSTRPEDYRLYMGQDYSPMRILSAAESFITRQSPAKPFFLYYAPTLPHAALQVPDPLVARFRGSYRETGTDGEEYSPHPTPRAARAAMIARLDDEVGRLRATLRQQGLERNTLVVFLSDNGPSAEGGADIRFFNSAGGLRGEKRDLYEGGIRSPMIAYWPGRVAGGRRATTIAATWDLMPTFADLLGVKQAPESDGRSFLPALYGRPMAATGPLYWEMHGDDHSAQAVRDGRWKAVRWQPGGFDPARPIELYDLTTDPAETRDVAARNPRVVARMRTLLARRTVSDVPQFNFPAPRAGGGSTLGISPTPPR